MCAWTLIDSSFSELNVDSTIEPSHCWDLMLRNISQLLKCFLSTEIRKYCSLAQTFNKKHQIFRKFSGILQTIDPTYDHLTLLLKLLFFLALLTLSRMTCSQFSSLFTEEIGLCLIAWFTCVQNSEQDLL